VRRALDDGVGRDEIEHTILLSLTTAGFAAMIAALKWAREVFDVRAT
jgi:alkylhydroperoxidase/carboxymuconolactone decarboxylase family protein YurZ